MQSLRAIFLISKFLLSRIQKNSINFTLGQRSHLEEALTFITEHANACSSIVEGARSKYMYKSSSSHKQIVRKMNKRAKVVESDND